MFSRKVVAYSISSSINSNLNLAINTFNEAFIKRDEPSNLIFHSDCGSQYTSKQFRDLLDKCNVTQSFSKPKCPYDNAVSESFF